MIWGTWGPGEWGWGGGGVSDQDFWTTWPTPVCHDQICCIFYLNLMSKLQNYHSKNEKKKFEHDHGQNPSFA